jgi:hypothetical protein
MFSGYLAPIGLGNFHPSPSPGRTAIQLALSPVQQIPFAALETGKRGQGTISGFGKHD